MVVIVFLKNLLGNIMPRFDGLTHEEKWVQHFATSMEGVVIHFSPLTSQEDPSIPSTISDLLTQIHHSLGMHAQQLPQSPSSISRISDQATSAECFPEPSGHLRVVP